MSGQEELSGAAREFTARTRQQAEEIHRELERFRILAGTDGDTLLLRLPTEDHAALRRLAFFSGRSMNEIVSTVLHDYLTTTGRRDLVDAVTSSGQEEMRDLLDKLAITGDTGTS